MGARFRLWLPTGPRRPSRPVDLCLALWPLGGAGDGDTAALRAGATSGDRLDRADQTARTSSTSDPPATSAEMGHTGPAEGLPTAPGRRLLSASQHPRRRLIRPWRLHHEHLLRRVPPQQAELLQPHDLRMRPLPRPAQPRVQFRPRDPLDLVLDELPIAPPRLTVRPRHPRPRSDLLNRPRRHRPVGRVVPDLRRVPGPSRGQPALRVLAVLPPPRPWVPRGQLGAAHHADRLRHAAPDPPATSTGASARSRCCT